MNLKKIIIWQKMLYNRGGAWIPDGVVGGLFAILLYTNQLFYIVLLMLLRWVVGFIDYKLKIIQIESELGIKRQNPYLDRRLNGINRRNGTKAKHEAR